MEIWRFETDRFAVIYSVEPEDDMDWSWDEDGAAREKVEDGVWECFVAKVSVDMDGVEIAADYLGGCVYESFEAFMDHRGVRATERQVSEERGHAVLVGSYFSGMVRQAVCEARAWVSKSQGILRAA